MLDPIYKALPCGTLQTLSSPPAEQLCNFMQACKDPVGSRLHHTSQSGSVYVWFGEVEVLELFLKIFIVLRHKELSVSQFEVVFLTVLPTFSVKAMTTASDGPQNIPLITYYLKIKLCCGVQTVEEVLRAELCLLFKHELLPLETSASYWLH